MSDQPPTTLTTLTNNEQATADSNYSLRDILISALVGSLLSGVAFYFRDVATRADLQAAVSQTDSQLNEIDIKVGNVQDHARSILDRLSRLEGVVETMDRQGRYERYDEPDRRD